MAGSLGAVASIAGLVLGGTLFGALGPLVFLASSAAILAAAVLAIPLRRIAGEVRDR